MTGTVPLHPAIVHLPIALAVLLPLLALAALAAWWRGWLPGRRVWLGIVGLQAVLLVSGIAALRTGEGEEDRVERVIAGQALERHEEAAELFLWGACATLLLAALVLAMRQDRAARALASMTVLGTIVVLGLGYRTGKAGGELVYAHGAAAAYASPAAHPGAAARALADGDGDRD